MESRLFMIEAKESLGILSALASEPRLAILELLNGRKLSVNDVAKELSLPQSTISTNIKILEDAGLISVETAAGKKGTQKEVSVKEAKKLLEAEASRELLDEEKLKALALEKVEKGGIVLREKRFKQKASWGKRWLKTECRFW